MGDRKRDYQPGELVPGSVYRVVRLIGAGGMGTVYDVEDTTVGKRYVLKTLHPELGNRQDLARRMQAEARTLARLSHPNIVEVVTAGATTDDLRLPYYVMEKLNGQNLRTILNKKRSLDLSHALHIAIDLLDALDCAHEKNVIHRDVKPDNIFLHRMPNNGITLTKLLDFGIMRLLDAGDSATAGRFMGTLRYAAPEQLRGENVTPQTDLYAAGLVLYEMIAGKGPFDEEIDQKAIAASHLNREPPLLLDRGIIIPQTLEKLIRASLSKYPDRRPKDAFTFSAQLRNLKKTLQNERPPENTNDRKTDAMVLSQGNLSQPPSSPIPLLGSANPFSPLPISPVVSPPPGYESAPSPRSPAAYADTVHARTQAQTPVAKAVPPGGKDTLVGMSPPTMAGSTLEDANVLATWVPSRTGTATGASSPRGSPIDRGAPTRSLAPDSPPRLGPDGTQPMPVMSADFPLPSPEGPVPGVSQPDPAEVAAQQLLRAYPPPEQPPAPSVDASVRSVMPAPVDRKRSIAVAFVAIGSFGVVVTAALAIALRVHRAAEARSSEPSSFVSMPSAAVAPPVLAPPLFDEIPSSVPAPSSSAPANATASAGPVAAVAAPAPTPAASPSPMQASPAPVQASPVQASASAASPPSPSGSPATVAADVAPARPKPVHVAKPPAPAVTASQVSPMPSAAPKRRLPGSGL